MKIKKSGLAILLAVAVIAGGILGGSAVLRLSHDESMVLVKKESFDSVSAAAKKYEKLEYLYKVIQANYYGEVDDDKLMEGIYKGLFGALDKYSTYLNADEFKTMMESTTGSFCGIGVYMSATEDDVILIVRVVEDSPADKAGIQAGDVITAVDDVPYKGSEIDVAAAKMRGERGTSVKLTYLRDGERMESSMRRNEITTISVYPTVLEDENLGYIRITSFETHTGSEFKDALREMELKGVDGLIIDLRNNGGGVVDACIEIADMLLPECNIISIESRNGEVEYFNSDAKVTSLPYVLIVNAYSASASEILSVAVKENGGGAIVGTTTFGKGVVQTVMGLRGSDDAFKLTYAEYFGPNHVKINGIGVEPDYTVELSDDWDDYTDYQLIKAIELLSAHDR